MFRINQHRVLFAFILPVLWAFNINAQNVPTLSAKEFESKIKQADVQVLDVRTMQEYQSGHIANSFLADWTNKQQFKKRVEQLDKDKPVYTYCLSGVRSTNAAAWLKENGFTNVYNLEGGINAWKKSGLPIEGQSNVKQVTMEEYLAGIPKDKTVLVDFSATWCPPCKKMEPIISKLMNEQGKKTTLIRIDGGEQSNLSNQLSIDEFPTFIIYKQGKETWRNKGIVAREELIQQLN